MNSSAFRVEPGEKARLNKRKADDTHGFRGKTEAKSKLERDIARMQELQDVFYAADTYSLLIVFQALDAAGKDGAIKHVMSGMNPQGCKVAAFKAPGPLALDHDYLWRCNIVLPPRGCIGIFNRSYYEEVLVTRVHPEILEHQKLPPETLKGNIWKRRYEEINNYEKYLHANGTRIVKFFLHISKDEQKRRFLERIDEAEKNWKFSLNDVKERAHWKDYMKAYDAVFTHTSTPWAPWYVIPADNKWFMRLAVSHIINYRMKELDLHYPKIDQARKKELFEARERLLGEEG
jgi:PPK2 family polyphosphate:nucleotide phosphotransferase